MSKAYRRHAIGMGLMLLMCQFGPSVAQGVSVLGEVKPPDMKGDFKGKDVPVAINLSGIACAEPPGAAQRTCLVIDDEGRFAQTAQLGPDTLTPGQAGDLIGKDSSPTTVGKLLPRKCGTEKAFEFKEFDGEAVAFGGGRYYVVGSHGCARNAEAFRPSSFILARVAVGATGTPVVEATSYRLSDAILSQPKLAPFYAKKLNSAKGLNVEGLAVVGDDLYAGLRAPSLGGTAFLLRTSVAALFAADHAPLAARSETIPMQLGEGLGVRDLAAMPDGRLLVLAGPSVKEDVPYRLFAVGLHGGAVAPLGALPPFKDSKGEPAKAEAALVVRSAPGRLDVLILFDGLPNGGPRTFCVPLQPGPVDVCKPM